MSAVFKPMRRRPKRCTGSLEHNDRDQHSIFHEVNRTCPIFMQIISMIAQNRRKRPWAPIPHCCTQAYGGIRRFRKLEGTDHVFGSLTLGYRTGTKSANRIAF